METKDKYKELSCEFLNQAFCEEVLEEEGSDLDEAERLHFEEEDYAE